MVDPCEESRTFLTRLLGGITSIWLAQVLSSYEEAITGAEDLAAQITIVVLDHNANQAVDLIQEITQVMPAQSWCPRAAAQIVI